MNFSQQWPPAVSLVITPVMMIIIVIISRAIMMTTAPLRTKLMNGAEVMTIITVVEGTVAKRTVIITVVQRPGILLFARLRHLDAICSRLTSTHTLPTSRARLVFSNLPVRKKTSLRSIRDSLSTNRLSRSWPLTVDPV